MGQKLQELSARSWILQGLRKAGTQTENQKDRKLKIINFAIKRL